jgi:hypothetical protein
MPPCRHQEKDCQKKGIPMSTVGFEMPVIILVGLGFPCRIRSANAALVYLEGRPIGERDEVWEATLAACRDAVTGVTTAEEARDVFMAFARRRDILAEEQLPYIEREVGQRAGT